MNAHSTDRPSIAWIEGELAAPVVSATPLPGGMSSLVTRCELADGRTIVVRRVADHEWLRHEPQLLAREAHALDLLATSRVPTPRLVALDSGAGLLAMTMLPGEVRTDAQGLLDRIDALARLAARIADVELPAAHGLPGWSPWAPTDPTPPEWGDHGLWTECIAAFEAARRRPRVGTTLLHRDLHPLNVLWTGREVTGLVDWMKVCVGHPHAELSHCRWNLAVLVGQHAADQLLDTYFRVCGADPYDHWWDLSTAVGLLPGPIGTSGWHTMGRSDLTDRRVVEATESFVRAALDG